MPFTTDKTAWTDIGQKVVTPSYYAFVNGAFVNVNSGTPIIDISPGLKQSRFVPKRGEVDLGHTDPLPTTKQPSEFNCALGVGVIVGFTSAIEQAQLEHQKVLEGQLSSIAETDLAGCIAGLLQAQLRASVTLINQIAAKTLKGHGERILIHGHSRR